MGARVWNHERLEELWSRVGRIDTTAAAASSAAAAAASTSAVTKNYTAYGSLPAASTAPGEIVRVTTANGITIYVSGERTGTGNGFEWIPIYAYDA